MAALLLALTAIYTRELAALGGLLLIGYVTAFLGTVMVAGDWWFEAFAVPTIASAAPAVLDLPLSGPLLVGAIATVGLYTVGWTAVRPRGASHRPPPRRGSVAARRRLRGPPCGPSTPYQIPLAIAIGWIGLTLRPGISSSG